MRPDPHSHAIASIIGDLIQTKEATSYFAGKISGMLMRYNLPGDHPVIGCSAPDFELEDGTRLAEFLHDGKGLLLDITESQQLCTFAQRWKERLKYVSARAKDSKELTAILVRPDGFVASATESEPDSSAAEKSFKHWFGDAS